MVARKPGSLGYDVAEQTASLLLFLPLLVVDRGQADCARVLVGIKYPSHSGRKAGGVWPGRMLRHVSRRKPSVTGLEPRCAKATSPCTRPSVKSTWACLAYRVNIWTGSGGPNPAGQEGVTAHRSWQVCHQLATPLSLNTNQCLGLPTKHADESLTQTTKLVLIYTAAHGPLVARASPLLPRYSASTRTGCLGLPNKHANESLVHITKFWS